RSRNSSWYGNRARSRGNTRTSSSDRRSSSPSSTRSGKNSSKSANSMSSSGSSGASCGSSCCSGQGSWTSGKSASGEPGSTSSGRFSAAAASGGTPRSAQASGLATASSGISSSSVGRVSLSCAAIGQAISEADAANATMRRRKLGELVLLLSARRPVLAAAFDADGLFAPGGGDGADEGTLLVGGEASPAGRSEPLERAIADLVLHPRRSIDPIAEIDVGKAGLGRPADMIENNVV